MDLGENLNDTMKGIIADVRLTQPTYWYAIISAYIAVCIASMCICVILLESLSGTFCCAVLNVAARILVATMVILTVMARLVSHVSRIVAWLIAHRYV